MRDTPWPGASTALAQLSPITPSWSIAMHNVPPFEFIQHNRLIRMHLPDPKDHIQQQIRHHGRFYEQAMLDEVAPRLPEHALVVDVGANIGNHTVYLSKVMGLKVIAVEPNPPALRLLRQNIQLNEVHDQVELHEVALGAEDGEATMEDNDPNNLGRASVAMRKAGTSRDVKVQVRRLDDIVGDRQPALIKIDVEGMEPAVLRGATAVLQRVHPDLLIEAATSDQLASVEEIIRPLGYVRVAVYCDTPTYLFHHRAAEVRHVLDHLPASTLARLPATRRIVAGMATVKGNEQGMLTAVASLMNQVDHLYLYLNGHETVPTVLNRFGDRITPVLDPDGSRLGDAGKFVGVAHEPASIYLTCDDDIAYPKDYVLHMCQALAAQEGQAAVGVHGCLLNQPLTHYYDPKTRHVVHFESLLMRNRHVHVLGTGTVAFHTSVIHPTLDDFPAPNMADIWFARWLQARKLPSVAVSRPARWLQAIPVNRQSIYEASQGRQGGAFDSSRRQDEVVATMLPISLAQSCPVMDLGAYVIELRTTLDLTDLMESLTRYHRNTIIVLVDDRRSQDINVTPQQAFNCELHWIQSEHIQQGHMPLPEALRTVLREKARFMEFTEVHGMSHLRPLDQRQVQEWQRKLG